jgi:bifunctional UDP-N-acetylglucosamine pyrophosphorylase/glucosamine-1-phosphate N-acetyltransferase/UDP-N-acetylglucosamine pyrophosphorylase
VARKLAVVMAAGKGTRMKSDLPKVLFPVRGRPMIEYVLDALQGAGIDETIVVVGYRADDVRRSLAHRPGLQFALQREQLGTGHAVMSCREFLSNHQGPVFVVAGDAPLLQADTVAALLADFQRAPAACLLGTVHRADPAGLGRIVRDAAGNFQAIVEHRDATPEQLKISEVNMSYYVFHCPDLLAALGKIRDANSQGEYYLTDCPGVLAAEGKTVRALAVLKPFEALGINTVNELAAVEAAMQDLGL